MGPSSADSLGNGPKLLSLKIIISITDTKNGTMKDKNNDEQSTATTPTSLSTAEPSSRELPRRGRKPKANETQSKTEDVVKTNEDVITYPRCINEYQFNLEIRKQVNYLVVMIIILLYIYIHIYFFLVD